MKIEDIENTDLFMGDLDVSQRIQAYLEWYADVKKPDDVEQVDFQEVLNGIKACYGSDADIQERLGRIDRWADLLEVQQTRQSWGVENLEGVKDFV